ncbi:hypothetical protein FKM82_026683, partial [Ascaphus truei]
MALPSRQSVRDWARQQHTPSHRVVAVSQVPISLPLETLQTALRQLPGFSKARLVDVEIDKNPQWNTLLVDCHRDIVLMEPQAPQFLQLPNAPPGGSPLIYPLVEPQTEVQSLNLAITDPVSQEAELLRDMIQNLTEKISQLTPPPSLPSLVEALTLASHSQNCRKLKTFSGVLPTPTGEEGIEPWKEHTTTVMEERSCTEAVKRQRLMECLKPPASTLASIHREQYLDLTSRLIVEFLTEAYGVTEDDGALWAKYYAINQQEGEDLSAFIHRVQIALGPLLHRKVVLASQTDEYLRKQYLQGSSPNHPIANMIRDNLMRGSPPTFTGLLRQ